MQPLDEDAKHSPHPDLGIQILDDGVQWLKTKKVSFGFYLRGDSLDGGGVNICDGVPALKIEDVPGIYETDNLVKGKC